MRIPHISFKQKHLFFLCAGVTAVLLCFCLRSPDFDSFTMEIFRQELSGNTLSLHYTLADPASFDIAQEKISLGTLPATPDSESLAALQNLQIRLKAFSENGLTPDEQRTADLLSWWLTGQAALYDYYYLQEPLGPTLGIQAQLPILLSEYVFRNKQDVQNYLELLKQLPAYFSEIADFEQLKADSGLLMNAESLQKVINQCREFSSDAETHFLTSSFQKRISECNFLSSDEQITCEIRHQKLLHQAVFPAYTQLAADLDTMLPLAPSEPLGLAHVPNGTSYFQWLLTYQIGTDRTISEIRDLLEEQIATDYETILEAVQNGVDLLHPVSEHPLFDTDTDPETILHRLALKCTLDFPDIPAISWKIKTVPDSLASTLSPAFFLTPPLDIPEENIIYVNPAYEPDEKELVTTLAHEGYPGHLYQNTFESSLPPIRSLFHIGGYTEGWGLYSELYAYDFLGYSTETASALRALSSLNYAICSVLDLEVHTSGWTEGDCSNYLQSFGITDAEQAHSLYITILEEPANYLKYYLGYLEICKLKESAFALSPDLSLIEFHRWFLEEGPTPFSLLQKDLPDLCHENSLK